MTMKSAAVFEVMDKTVKSTPALLKKVNAVYQFNIDFGGKKNVFTVDVKNAATAGVKEGAAEKADCTITMTDDDFFDMSTGKLDGMAAFGQGKLKVSGNIMLAQKLNTITQSARA
eukprot:TRINITY_DN3901_c0_g1_i1.p1 TRINITY_DN3901_c0_g1~~TRINITY_DN3901_c0_g1_i1.p1  ORF type:complete len:115 (-),score=35.67 TRINITY_DN3901_c0_g1_i1:46-390(-)